MPCLLGRFGSLVCWGLIGSWVIWSEEVVTGKLVVLAGWLSGRVGLDDRKWVPNVNWAGGKFYWVVGPVKEAGRDWVWVGLSGYI